MAQYLPKLLLSRKILSRSGFAFAKVVAVSQRLVGQEHNRLSPVGDYLFAAPVHGFAYAFRMLSARWMTSQ